MKHGHYEAASARIRRQVKNAQERGIILFGRRVSLNGFLLLWVLTLIVLHALCQLAAWRLHYSSVRDLSDVEFWRGRHLIFCVSPGRAGSNYLRGILSTAQDTFSRHEPYPRMNGEILKTVLLHGRRKETYNQRVALKIGAMRESLEGTVPSMTYVETSHMFVKTFSDVVLGTLGNIAKISIVVLHRPIVDVMLSQMKLGWFLKGHSGQNVWYYNVADLHPSERKVRAINASDSSVLAQIAGYNADIQVRIAELRDLVIRNHALGLWQQVQVVDARLGELVLDSNTSTANIERFLKQLGLIPDVSRIASHGERDRNTRDRRKDMADVHVSREFVMSRLSQIQAAFPMLTNPE